MGLRGAWIIGRVLVRRASACKASARLSRLKDSKVVCLGVTRQKRDFASVTPLWDRNTLSLIRWRDKEIYLVGTAHVSSKSKEQVKQVIHTVKPDTVFVELCKDRALKMWSRIHAQRKWDEGSAGLSLRTRPFSNRSALPD